MNKFIESGMYLSLMLSVPALIILIIHCYGKTNLIPSAMCLMCVGILINIFCVGVRVRAKWPTQPKPTSQPTSRTPSRSPSPVPKQLTSHEAMMEAARLKANTKWGVLSSTKPKTIVGKP